MRPLFLTALLSTVAITSGTALAQSPQCDKLVAYFQSNNTAETNADYMQARTLQTSKNEAECTTMLQRVSQAGNQPAQQGNTQGATGANIVVQQPAPTITVDQAQPQISVQQAAPTVSVRQPQPEILVRQPAPVVTIDIPQPEIIVRMPKPEVAVQQAQPQVQVQQAQPQVHVEQPSQPQVQVQQAQPANVAVTNPDTQAQVQVEETGQPKVTFERAEPKVTVNQAQGQPTIRMEPMEGQGADQGNANQAAADQTANQTAAGQTGNQAAADQTGNQQQAVLTDQPATSQAQMQQIALSDLNGRDVVNEQGEKLGTADGVVQSTTDKKQYLVIKHGGFLGLGEKTTALSLDGLMMRGNKIVVAGLTNDQIRAMPRFEDNRKFPRFTGQMVEMRTAAQ